MIDADKLLHMTREELLTFDAQKNIIAIDNKLKHNNVIYELTEFDMKVLYNIKTDYGYDKNYNGPEKNDDDARTINRLILAYIHSLVRTIDNHIEHNCLKQKIIMKII